MMTLQTCYEKLGGDYKDAIGRLRSERLLQKFVLKFLDDKSFELLCSSLGEGNREEAFRASHTIKGMCQNLSFTSLAESSSELTEALRSEPGGAETPFVRMQEDSRDKTEELFDRVQKDYQRTTEAIRAFQKELGD